MDYYNELPRTTKVESSFGKYENYTEAKRYWPNSYSSIIGMIFICLQK